VDVSGQHEKICKVLLKMKNLTLVNVSQIKEVAEGKFGRSIAKPFIR
jgi:hypothetical protein